MAGKSGKRITGRKPTSVRRQSARKDGAFGKEQPDRVKAEGADRNIDKAVRKSGGAA